MKWPQQNTNLCATIVYFTLLITGCTGTHQATQSNNGQPQTMADQSNQGSNHQILQKKVADQAEVRGETAKSPYIAHVTPPPLQETPSSFPRVALETIYFGFNSDVLSDSARESITRDFNRIREIKNIAFVLEGNCDELGNTEYNLGLGEQRAKEVKKNLAALGIPEDRLITISYGKEHPVDTGHTEEAWSKTGVWRSKVGKGRCQ